jgi:hypothetical protein
MILGAAVGANLTLLALDIAWDRQVRDRFTAASAKETLGSASRPVDDYLQRAGPAECGPGPLRDVFRRGTRYARATCNPSKRRQKVEIG